MINIIIFLIIVTVVCYLLYTLFDFLYQIANKAGYDVIETIFLALSLISFFLFGAFAVVLVVVSIFSLILAFKS